MRHGNKTKKLGRTMEHRAAMLSNMASSLIEHKRITTTIQKAKALRRYIEPLITRAKSNTTHNRRVVFSYLQNKESIKELFDAVAIAVGDRPGGYVRIIRTGYRHGDAAEMAMIELVDFNPDYNGGAKADSGKGKKRRTRRGGAGKVAVAAPVAAAAVAAVAAEVEEAEDAVDEIIEESNDAIAEANEQAAAAFDEVETVAEEAVESAATEVEAVAEEVAAPVVEAIEEAAEEAAEDITGDEAPANEEE
jgi:large subunit ribosomal protein L17